MALGLGVKVLQCLTTITIEQFFYGPYDLDHKFKPKVPGDPLSSRK
jgi:hypothetical protein